jgi:3-mercaptopyruvate sulfurtransferase SseA
MPALPVIGLAAEANEACVQAVPGAVFLRLRRTESDTVVRHMFVEMTLTEARELAADLHACIRQAETRLRG